MGALPIVTTGPRGKNAPMRKTKIVGTLGPTSSSPDVLSRLVKAGLDVARLNCSHASHADLAYQVEEAAERSLGGIATALLSNEIAGGMTGVYIALYATGNGAQSAAVADFDWFEYEPL